MPKRKIKIPTTGARGRFAKWREIEIDDDATADPALVLPPGAVVEIVNLDPVVPATPATPATPAPAVVPTTPKKKDDVWDDWWDDDDDDEHEIAQRRTPARGDSAAQRRAISSTPRAGPTLDDYEAFWKAGTNAVHVTSVDLAHV